MCGLLAAAALAACSGGTQREPIEPEPEPNAMHERRGQDVAQAQPIDGGIGGARDAGLRDAGLRDGGIGDAGIVGGAPRDAGPGGSGPRGDAGLPPIPGPGSGSGSGSGVPNPIPGPIPPTPTGPSAPAGPPR